MNTGQMLLTIGGLAILSMVILRVNDNSLFTTRVMLNNKFYVLAVSIGTSLIEEAESKSFDEATTSGSVDQLSELTSPRNLGKETGESYPHFDDFDDYNNLTLVDSTMPSAVFNIRCVVEYVATYSPEVKSNSKTWNKKMTVYVSSRSMEDTLTSSTIYSYWYFR